MDERCMTDRELLEFAAKACSLEHIHGYMELPWGYWIEDGVGSGWLWNPLTDDGDALRLAVQLGICIDIDLSDKQTWAIDVERNRSPIEPHGNNACAATRRAIVRAAAGIGKEKA